MQIHFLGGATTVTGSQYLLVTAQARVLIDCGMFQGSPNESIRNRVPFAFDPHKLDAVLLTHAHLDHCGLLPLLVKAGYRGADPRHGRHDRARQAGPSRLRQAPRGVRQARGTLGEAPPGRGRGGRPQGGRRVRRRPSPWQRPATSRWPRARRARPTAGRTGQRRDAAAPPAEAVEAIEAAAATEHVETTIEPMPPVWPSDPEAQLRAQPPHLDIDLDAPLYTAKDAEALAGQLLGRPLRRGGRGRARDARDVRRRRTHPGLGDHPAARPGRGRRRGARHRLLRRPRPARHADPARPDGDDRRRLRPRRVDLRRPRARARGRGDPGPRRDRPDGRRRGRRPARPVVRDRADAGGRLGARSAHRARRDPAPAALPRLADGLEGVRHLPPPSRLLRRGDGQAAARGRHAARLPEPDRHQRRQGVAGDRVRAAAVHDRGQQRDADRWARRRPPAPSHRRPDRDDPVRRLPGRGHARGAPPGRRDRGQARRPGPPGPLQDPLDQRLLGARRRARAARVARPFHRGQAAGRRRLSAPGLPRPRRPRARRSRSNRRCASMGFATHVPHWHERVTLD